MGWQYVQNREVITAMYRFNQAWLLDSTNAEAYHGFGYITGMFEAYKESFDNFDRGLRCDSSNIELLKDYVFMIIVKQKTAPSSSDISHAERLIRHTLAVNPNYAYAHHLNAKVLFYKRDYAEAWESLYLAKLKGSNSFDQVFIKVLHARMPDPRKELVKNYASSFPFLASFPEMSPKTPPLIPNSPFLILNF